MEFDYSQWQRTRPKPVSNNLNEQHQTQKQNAIRGKESQFSSRFTNDNSIKSSMFGSTASIGISSCHGGNKPGEINKRRNQDKISTKSKTEKLKQLNLKIKTRKITIQEYKDREEQLIRENIKLKNQIEDIEKSSLETVKHLLRKYEKYRGGMEVLKDRFNEDQIAANEILEQTQCSTLEQLSKIEEEYNNLNKFLLKKKQELSTLSSYKDKEYPVHALQIADLQKELKRLLSAQQDEESDLYQIIEHEVEKLKRNYETVKKEMTEKVTNASIEKMNPLLKEMAQQNKSMQKEIDIHLSEISSLELEINLMKEEINKLKSQSNNSIRNIIFPELMKKKTKCLPDSEIVLDIPKCEWLPI